MCFIFGLSSKTQKKLLRFAEISLIWLFLPKRLIVIYQLREPAYWCNCCSNMSTQCFFSPSLRLPEFGLRKPQEFRFPDRSFYYPALNRTLLECAWKNPWIFCGLDSLNLCICPRPSFNPVQPEETASYSAFSLISVASESNIYQTPMTGMDGDVFLVVFTASDRWSSPLWFHTLAFG